MSYKLPILKWIFTPKDQHKKILFLALKWDIFVILFKMIFLNFDEYFLKVLTRILARKNQLSVVEKNGLKNHIDYLRFLWRFNVDFLNQVHECNYPNIKHGNFCVRVKFIWINKYPLSIQKVRAKRAHAYFSACPSKNVARSNSFHERTVQISLSFDDLFWVP